MRRYLLALLFALAFGSRTAAAEGATGKLVFDLLPFVAEPGLELSKHLRKAFESRGLDWGVLSGQPNQVVVVAVPEGYFNLKLPNFSRYGMPQAIELPPGDYTLTCVGLEPALGLGGWRMLVRQHGYVNVDLLPFTIKEGETTVLETRTTIHRDRTGLAPIEYREIAVTVRERGAPTAEAVISVRTDSSIAWPDYHGPLKPRFTPFEPIPSPTWVKTTAESPAATKSARPR
jgi:hypothetical protein